MSPADIITAIGNSPIYVFLGVIMYLLWRELLRSRRECEGRINQLTDRQLTNVQKIAVLEGKLEMLTHATMDLNFPPPALRQPPTVFNSIATEPRNDRSQP